MTRWLVSLLLLFASAGVMGCPLCLGAYRSSLADQLVDANSVVLADLAADGRTYHVVAAIKGAQPRGGVIDAPSVATDSPAVAKVTQLLLGTEAGWKSLGAARVEHTSWLRRIAAGEHAAHMSLEEWQARVALMAPYLEHREALVAQIAYSELASAPYEALSATKPLLAASPIRRWLADPALAAREPLYLLLIGVAGNAQDTAMIERRLETGPTASLASLIAADLELRGPSRLHWVEERYLLDHDRPTTEIEAALLALSVQGTANRTIPRNRVIAAYRSFMTAHPDMAGYVARDLAAWQYWDAVPEYSALMKSGLRQQYPSQVAIVAYLREAKRISP